MPKSTTHKRATSESAIAALSRGTKTFTDRWTASRKANVVATILSNHLTARAARLRWGVSAVELRRWVHLYRDHGVAALKTTRVQQYRPRARLSRESLLEMIDRSPLTDQQVARRVGITVASIVNWRTGRNFPSPSSSAMVERILTLRRQQ
jgi:transposase-like protein